MAETIVFPDVEDLTRQYLGSVLDVECFASITPPALPVASVTIVRTGGAATSLVTDEALLALHCRAASSPLTALLLARDARAAMHAAAREGWLSGVPCYASRDLSGPYLNPDPVNPGQFRFTVNLSVTVRGQVV